MHGDLDCYNKAYEAFQGKRFVSVCVAKAQPAVSLATETFGAQTVVNVLQ